MSRDASVSTRIMIVDDEKSMCEFMQIMLSREGYEVFSNQSAQVALQMLSDKQNSPDKVDLVIADLMMPEMSGIRLLDEAKAIDPDLDFIVMTAFASVETAIEALKKGAFDYVTKPFRVDEIKIAVKKIEERKRIQRENQQLKDQLRTGFDAFITDDSNVRKILDLGRRVANSDTTILLLGESGVGKEVLAKAIHAASNRHNGPFVSVNCGALPENLLESELFGHVRGSFTGAIRDKQGLFAAADGGTILLDEVGETSPAIQVKLLRALEEKTVTPVGGTKPVTVDVRIIASTNADLARLSKSGNFRPDLFYRLNVFPLVIPPLRERRRDIPLLANYFVKRHCAKLEISEKSIHQATQGMLLAHDWPGNVRQLENVLERAVLLAKGDTIMPSDLPELADVSDDASTAPGHSMAGTGLGQQPDLESVEKAYIYYVLAQENWHKSKAAKVLGIDVSTLYRKIERYGIEIPASEK